MSFDNLIDDVLVNILKYLNDGDLRSARLVCRNWAEIISDYIELRRPYSLKLSSDTINDQHPFVQTFMNSKYNIFTDIQFYNVDIQDSEIVAKLLSKIGPGIKSFSLYAVYSPLNYSLIKLLKNTPNLVELNIEVTIEYDSSDDFESDELIGEFSLKRLKKVRLNCQDSYLCDCLMKLLSKSVNSLTSLKVKIQTLVDFTTLYSLIESQRHSLKRLYVDGIDVGENEMHSYLSIEHLSLEAFVGSSNIELDSDLLQVLGNHKNLRELRCYVFSRENLREYPLHLPQLETLELHISIFDDDVDYPFPTYFNNLKSLTMYAFHFGESIINFDTPTACPTLEALEIVGSNSAQITTTSLQSFIDNYPNLRELKLSDYSCESCNVAAICDKLLQLEKLELRIPLNDPDADRNAFSNISKLRKLKHLKIFEFIYICDDEFFIEHLRLPALTFLRLQTTEMFPVSGVTNRGISALINNCPLLEHLHLDNLDGVTDACLDEIVERLVHLKVLEISGQLLTEEKLEEIENILHHRELLLNQ